MLLRAISPQKTRSAEGEAAAGRHGTASWGGGGEAAGEGGGVWGWVEVSPAVGRLVETAELRVSSCTVGANGHRT